MVNEAEIKAGQAVYTPFMLKIYNILVLDVSNNFIWRSSKWNQLAQYNRYVRPNHLDIGVGTGFYLKNTTWPENTQLSLMDLNPSCLDSAKQVVEHLNVSPKCFQADIFKPQPELAEKFDSVSINYLLHCLPGDMKTKSVVIENAAAMLKPQGILFGSTILSDPGLQTFLSKKLMAFYNGKKIFSNQQDDHASVREVLEQHLTDVEIQIQGCVALFKGIKQ